MLLLDKLTPKSSKKAIDPSVLFSLPLSVFDCFTGESRFQVSSFLRFFPFYLEASSLTLGCPILGLERPLRRSLSTPRQDHRLL
jgi:hypothetical protein